MSKDSLFSKLRNVLGSLAADRDAARMGPEIDESGIAHAASGWKPKDIKRRIEIMVTGDPSRVGAVADTVDTLQKQIFGAEALARLELRITGFLDGCIHRSNWSKKPVKAASQAREWHCEQSATRLSDAFAKSSGEMVDAIVLIAHRFDDDIGETLKKAEQLKEQGVEIHVFHTGGDADSRAAYEKLTEETGGVFMQLPSQESIGEVMPILMAHINRDEEFLALQPQNESAKKLKQMLTADKGATASTFLAEDVAPIFAEDDDD